MAGDWSMRLSIVAAASNQLARTMLLSPGRRAASFVCLVTGLPAPFSEAAARASLRLLLPASSRMPCRVIVLLSRARILVRVAIGWRAGAMAGGESFLLPFAC